MNNEKLAKESRALFMKWVETLTDDDIDKLLGVPKEKSLEEKFFEWDNTYQRESQMRGMAMTSATYLSQLAQIAKEHFKP